MSTKLTQNGNEVGGDIVGRDKIVHVTINHPEKKEMLKELVRLYEYEKENNIEFRGIIEKLERFKTTKQNESIIGLKAKLENAKRSSSYSYANETKELFFKRLIKHEFSESAQKIYAYLLAELYSRFGQHVVPRIKEELDPLIIDEIVQKKVIDEVSFMTNSGEVLGIYPDEVYGMMYFLTGNCHLDWV